MSKVWKALREDVREALVKEDIEPFTKGILVELRYTLRETILAEGLGEAEELWEEYNLETHKDYDRFFKLV